MERRGIIITAIIAMALALLLVLSQLYSPASPPTVATPSPRVPKCAISWDDGVYKYEITLANGRGNFFAKNGDETFGGKKVFVTYFRSNGKPQIKTVAGNAAVEYWYVVILSGSC